MGRPTGAHVGPSSRHNHHHSAPGSALVNSTHFMRSSSRTGLLWSLCIALVALHARAHFGDMLTPMVLQALKQSIQKADSPQYSLIPTCDLAQHAVLQTMPPFKPNPAPKKTTSMHSMASKESHFNTQT